MVFVSFKMDKQMEESKCFHRTLRRQFIETKCGCLIKALSILTIKITSIL